MWTEDGKKEQKSEKTEEVQKTTNECIRIETVQPKHSIQPSVSL